MDDKGLVWENYKHIVDLHRSYLDILIKLNAFYYAITGAIISFYFLHIKNEPLVVWSLVLPIVMSMGLAIFFFRSALATRPSQEDIETLAGQLGFKTYSVVAKVLEVLLWIFFVTVVVVALGLVVLFFKDFRLVG